VNARTIARWVLGATLALAGITHLTTKRLEFQAQVPDWVGLDKNLVVVVSGLVEVALGVALLVARRQRPMVGLVAGVFFIAIFPGNISQYIDGHDAFGLDSDGARLARLFFQPVLVAWAWWCTGAVPLLRGLVASVRRSSRR
jgi:uncharacterized membrane protein